MAQGGQIPDWSFQETVHKLIGWGRGTRRMEREQQGGSRLSAGHTERQLLTVTIMVEPALAPGPRAWLLGTRPAPPSLPCQDHTAHLRVMASAGKPLIYFQLRSLVAGGPHAPGPHGSQTNRRSDLTWVQNALEGPAGGLLCL